MLKQNKHKSNNALLRLILLKHLIVSPAWLILGYAFPIIFIIFVSMNQLVHAMHAYGNPSISEYAFSGMIQNVLYLEDLLGAAILLPVAYFGILNLIFVFGPTKQLNINKIYATLNISRNKYFRINFFINCIHVFIICNLVLIIFNFICLPVYKATAFQISPDQYFSYLFIAFTAFIFTYLFSCLIVSLTNNLLLMLFIGFCYYMLSLTTSGTIMPPFAVAYHQVVMDGDHLFSADSYLRWLQYLTPMGCGQRLNLIMLFNTNYEICQSHDVSIWADVRTMIPNQITIWDVSAPKWDNDWLNFVSPALQNVLLVMLLMKFKTWRYHKNIKPSSLKKLSLKRVTVNH